MGTFPSLHLVVLISNLLVIVTSHWAYEVHGFSQAIPSKSSTPPSTSPTPSSSISSYTPVLPDTATAIARQAAISITNAMYDGKINKQTIRLPLSESMYSTREEGFVADRAIGWQGGPQETIQYLLPLATQVVQEISTRHKRRRPTTSSSIAEDDDGGDDDAEVVDTTEYVSTGGLVSKITNQILLDFDGSCLVTSEHPAGPIYDVQAVLQPNTDKYYSKLIKQIEEQFSDTPSKPQRLFLLINPSWRNKDSWGIFESSKAQKDILDRYEVTYCVDQFVVRGIKLSLLKEYNQPWAVFITPMPYNKIKQKEQKTAPTLTSTSTTLTDATITNNLVQQQRQQQSPLQPQLIGTFPHRPSYQELDTLLVEYLTKQNQKQ